MLVLSEAEGLCAGKQKTSPKIYLPAKNITLPKSIDPAK